MIAYTLLIGLATYRLWRVAASDEITARPRAWLLRRDDVASGFIVYLITCIWCLGWWIAGALSLSVAMVNDWHPLTFLLVWCGSSVVAGAADGLIDRIYD